MQALAIGGAVFTIIALIALWVIVHLAREAGEGAGAVEHEKALNERNKKADAIGLEPVADEQAWIEQQLELARKVAASRATPRDRLREYRERSRAARPPAE